MIVNILAHNFLNVFEQQCQLPPQLRNFILKSPILHQNSLISINKTIFGTGQGSLFSTFKGDYISEFLFIQSERNWNSSGFIVAFLRKALFKHCAIKTYMYDTLKLHTIPFYLQVAISFRFSQHENCILLKSIQSNRFVVQYLNRSELTI